jgi:hypothetical protein
MREPAWRWQVSSYNTKPDRERNWEPIGTVRASNWRNALRLAREAFPDIPEHLMCVVRGAMETV